MVKKESSDNIQTVDETPPLTSQPMLQPGETIIGTLVGINEQGEPLIDFPENPTKHALAAIATFSLTQQHTNRQVTLLFVHGDLRHPVITGLIYNPLQTMLENFNPSQVENHSEVESEIKVDNVRIDGDQLIFEAKKEMVFQCGKASFVLKKNGEISLRGTKISTHSTGVNRIMGASIQLN